MKIISIANELNHIAEFGTLTKAISMLTTMPFFASKESHGAKNILTFFLFLTTCIFAFFMFKNTSIIISITCAIILCSIYFHQVFSRNSLKFMPSEAKLAAKTESINFSFEAIPLFAITLVGSSICAKSQDFLTLFIGIEMISIPMYILLAFGGISTLCLVGKEKRQSTINIEASLKVFSLGALSTAIFVFGASYIYGSLGSISFIATNKHESQSADLLFQIGISLVFVSIMFKLAIFPLHSWFVDMAKSCSEIVTLLVSGVPKLAICLVFAQAILPMMLTANPSSSIIITLLCCASMVFAPIMMLKTKSVIRLLAYSSTANVSFLLAASPAYACQHGSCNNITLFFFATYIPSLICILCILLKIKRTKEDKTFEDIANFSQKNPIDAAILSIGVLSLIGIPPLSGFFGKISVMSSLANAAQTANIMPEWTIYLAILSSMFFIIVSGFAYFRILKAAYFSSFVPHANMEEKILPQHYTEHNKMISLLGICSALIIVTCGVWQWFFNLYQ